MNSAPIGVFDSGLGGLTSVKRLLRLLPNEDVIYLGDTGRVPYGTRSRETIIKYARQDVQFLQNHGVKTIIIACNTVSAVAAQSLLPELNIPVFEVVAPPSAEAARLTKNGRIGVIGTSATIKSGAYEAALRAINCGLFITSDACPLLVPLVENGRTDADDVAAQTIVRDYLEPLMREGIDTLVLGCTHYPLLRDVIARVAGSDIMLVDSGAVTAEFAAKRLGELDLLSGKTEAGGTRFYVTDSTEGFEAAAVAFLEKDVSGNVFKTTLE